MLFSEALVMSINGSTTISGMLHGVIFQGTMKNNVDLQRSHSFGHVFWLRFIFL